MYTQYTRQYVRAYADFSVIVTDKAGFSSGQVIDITIRGCGLRLTKPLRLGQHLKLEISQDHGTTVVRCDLAQVQWAYKERAGVVFLRMSPDNERRVHRLCLDRLRKEDEEVSATMSGHVGGLPTPLPPSHKAPTILWQSFNTRTWK